MYKLEIDKLKWEKVALAVGDTNPIHYLESGAICPGVYLFSEAEKILRNDRRFEMPLNIKGNFVSWVCDRDCLNLDKNYTENKSVFSYFKNNEKIGDFEFEKTVTSNNYQFNGNIEKARSIVEKDLESFNEALEIKNNNRVYSVFAFGRVLERFLIGRGGSLLSNIEFDFYKELNLGELLVEIEVDSNTRKRGRKEITDYLIRGKIIQSNEVVGMGFGKAQYKVVRNS